MAVLALDMRFFCSQSTATQAERLEAVTALLQTFVAPEDGEEEADQLPHAKDSESLRRALPAIDGDKYGRIRLTKRFIAGVILFDIVGYSWHRQDLAAGQENYLHVSILPCANHLPFLQLIVEQLLNRQVFKDASLHNMQAHIVASLIVHSLRELESRDDQAEGTTSDFDLVSELLEPVTAKITE